MFPISHPSVFNPFSNIDEEGILHGFGDKDRGGD